MLTIQIITIAVVALSLIAIYIITKHKGIAIPNTAYKIVSGVLAVTFFVRYMWDRDMLQYVVDLGNSPLASQAQTAIALVANWTLYSVILLVILCPFFRGNKMSMLVRYYGSAVVLFYIATLTISTTGLLGTEAYEMFNIRTLLIGIELGILIAVITTQWLSCGARCAKGDLWALVLIIAMLLSVMPAYMISALWGLSPISYALKEISLTHRLILYGAILLPLLMYIILRRRNKQEIRLMLTYICLGMLISFSVYKRFTDLTSLDKWPLHLCNTAMYIIPLCLIFRLDKVFYFTYFINVLGAGIALLIPNYSDGVNILSTTVISFYANHYIAFFMPLLMVALGLYGRPTIKYFKYSMIGFAVYFVAMLFANA